MADKKKTSELTTNSSPSTSTTLVGVDNGETVQIPITEFVTKDENGGVFIQTKRGENTIEVCETEDESFIAIQSNYLQLNGVGILRTYEGKDGNDGQVLTKKDGRVTWGDIPSGGGSGGGIIDVTELPTENIDTSAIYRVEEGVSATAYMGRQDVSSFLPIIVVDELPSVGIPSDMDNGITIYFLTTDQTLHCYFDAASAEMMDMPEGWSTFEDFTGETLTIVSSIDEIPEDDTEGSYVLVNKKTSLYAYSNGALEQLVTKSELNSNTSSGGGIIEVDTLPNVVFPNTIYKFYEIDTLQAVMVGETDGVITKELAPPEMMYIEVVDELPEVGENLIDIELLQQNVFSEYWYYSKADGLIHRYLSQEHLDFVGEGVVGWDTNEEASLPTIIYSLDEATNVDTDYFLATKKPHLYIYENGWVEIPVGFRIVHNPRLKTITYVES